MLVRLETTRFDHAPMFIDDRDIPVIFTRPAHELLEILEPSLLKLDTRFQPANDPPAIKGIVPLISPTVTAETAAIGRVKRLRSFFGRVARRLGF